MLRYLSENDKADLIEKTLSEVLKEATHTTKDIGGNATTQEFTDSIIRKIVKSKTVC